MAHVLIVTLALTCVAVPWSLGQRLGVLRLFSPLHLLAYFAAGGFLAKVLVFAIWPDRAFYRRFDIAPEALIWGALYLAAFVMFCCLGYVLACGRVRKGREALPLAALPVQERFLLFLIAASVTAAVAFPLIAARPEASLTETLIALNSAKQVDPNAAGVGATYAGLKSLFIVPKFAFVFFLAIAARRGLLRDWAYATVIGVLLVGIAVISGDRFELLELLLYTGITWVMVRGRASFRASLRFVGCVLIAIAAATVMTRWRGVESLWWQIVGSTYFLDINVAVMVVAKVAPEHLLWGQSYGWWSFGWVPRALWAEKPATDLGVYLKQVVMAQPGGGAFNVTGPGEAFINFGWVGMLVGLPLGALFRWGEVATCGRGAGPASALMYPLLVYPFVQAALQSSISAFLVTAAVQWVMIFALSRIFVLRSAPRQSFAGQPA